ncbi:MAG: hypothetical protein WDO19_15600 [Bacteroidota bacterium]
MTTLNGTVTVAKPDGDTSPVISVSYGGELIEFNADLNAINQLAKVQANTWDFKKQAISSGQASPTIKGPGNLSSEDLAKIINLPDYQLQTTAPLSDTDSQYLVKCTTGKKCILENNR